MGLAPESRSHPGRGRTVLVVSSVVRLELTVKALESSLTLPFRGTRWIPPLWYDHNTFTYQLHSLPPVPALHQPRLPSLALDRTSSVGTTQPLGDHTLLEHS